MCKKILFFIAISSLLVTSCKQESEPDLDDIKVIYCTPADLTQSLPLELVNTADGWQAKYIGVASKERILLKPRFSLDEYGDTLITFDEYVGGNHNGCYTLSCRTDMFSSNRELYYCSSSREDTITFFARIISEGDIYINAQDAKGSFTKLLNEREKHSTGGSEQIDINLTYLLHTNPDAFAYSVDGYDEFESVISEDRQLGFYHFTNWIAGNGIGSHFDTIVAQYKTKSGIVTLDDFFILLLCRLNEFESAGFPYCSRLNVMQATIKGKTHYLIETVYSDPEPTFFSTGDYSMKAYDLALFAFTLNNGKLMPSNILNGKSMIELVSVDFDDHIHFKYDDKKKTLQIPQLNTITHEFTGKYRGINL